MSQANGDTPKPAVSLFWDPETQAVSVTVDPHQVKNWAFGKAILEMAAKVADTQAEMAMVQAMQQKAMEQHKAEAIRRSIGI